MRFLIITICSVFFGILGAYTCQNTHVNGLLTNTSDIQQFLTPLPKDGDENDSQSSPKNNSTNITESNIFINEQITPTNNITNTAFEIFKDGDLGFSLKYPSNWSIDEDSSEHFTVVGFDSPDNDVSVDIRIFPEGDFNSIKEYGDKNFKEAEDLTLLQYYRNGTTLLSGKPALKAIYLTTYNPSIFEGAFGYQSSTSKAMMVATMVPEKDSIYAIAYFADSASFNDYLPDVENMIKSFQIQNVGPIIQEED